MGECANICENRLICYLGTVNAPFTTIRRIPPVFAGRSVKTGGLMSKTLPTNVKTESYAQIYQRVDAERRAAYLNACNGEITWREYVSRWGIN